MRMQHTHRRGVVNVWVALTLFMLVALAGLACDTGWCVLVLGQLQAAADASALAGAKYVKSDQSLARRTAYDFAYYNTAAGHVVRLNENYGNSGNADIVFGRYDRTAHLFTPTTTNPNAVKVIANRTSTGIDGNVPLVFGPAFGVT